MKFYLLFTAIALPVAALLAYQVDDDNVDTVIRELNEELFNDNKRHDEEQPVFDDYYDNYKQTIVGEHFNDNKQAVFGEHFDNNIQAEPRRYSDIDNTASKWDEADKDSNYYIQKDEEIHDEYERELMQRSRMAGRRRCRVLADRRKKKKKKQPCRRRQVW